MPAPADVTLSWDPNPETDLAGYKIYYGTSASVYGTVIKIVGLQTSYTLTGLAPGTYFFAITAYNTADLESGFSNEVSANLGSAGYYGSDYFRYFGIQHYRHQRNHPMDHG